MYTKSMHERIRKFTDKYYGQSLLTRDGLVQRDVSVADIEELLDRIEELEFKEGQEFENILTKIAFLKNEWDDPIDFINDLQNVAKESLTK